MSDQVCPTCNGAGELLTEEQAVYYEYSDGSKIPNPQIKSVLSHKPCTQCGGARWVNGTSR